MAVSYQESGTGLPEWYNQGYHQMQNLGMAGLSTPFQGYSGQLVSGLMPMQNQAASMAQNLPGTYQPYVQQSANLLSGSAQMSPTMQQNYNAMSTAGTNMLDTSGRTVSGALGADLVGAGAGQYIGANQAINSAGQTNLASAGAPLYGQASSLYSAGAKFDPSQLAQHFNPYVQNVVQELGRLGGEQFTNVINPALTSSFQGLGQQGSARQAALLADAAAKNQREVLGQQGNALNTGYNQAAQSYLNWAQQGNQAAAGLANLGQQQYNQLLGQANLGLNVGQQLTNLGQQQYAQQLGAAQNQLQGANQLASIGQQQIQRQQAASQLQEQGWQNYMGNQLNAGTAMGNLGQAVQQMGLADIGATNAAGLQQQQNAQKYLDAQYNEFLRQQQYPFLQAQAYSQLFPAAPSASSSWSTSFKKGGLARYADGGRFPREEPDDLISDLISRNLSSPSDLPDLAQQAGQMRMNMAQSLPTQALPERSMVDRLGSALFQASAQGPAHWGTLLGRVGSAFYGEEEARQAENRRLEQVKRAMQERLTTLSGFGGGRVLQGRQPTPEQLRTVYTSARNEAAQIAKDYQFPSAEARSAWIEQQAMATTENYLQNFATQPLGPRGGNLPMKGSALPEPSSAEAPSQSTRAPALEQWPQAFNEPRVKFDSPSANLPSLNMRGTPESVRAELETLQEPDRAAALRALEASQAPAGSQEVPSPPLRDKRAEQYKQAYGGEEGKALFKERENLNTLFGTNASMVNQLNLLENLYSNPNLPEGELGPLLQKIRSGFQTFGVDVGDTTGPADLANAVAQKMVLAQRTSDGTNLLPGAVSNFEVQLLQSMGPTLSLTNEGRQSLVRFMKEVALSNQRIAEEGSAFAAQNNEMLTPGWYKRKERVMLEEMARMKRLSDRTMTQFSNPEKGAR